MSDAPHLLSQYLPSTLKGTLTYSNHSSTGLYETYIASCKNLDVYEL